MSMPQKAIVVFCTDTGVNYYPVDFVLPPQNMQVQTDSGLTAAGDYTCSQDELDGMAIYNVLVAADKAVLYGPDYAQSGPEQTGAALLVLAWLAVIDAANVAQFFAVPDLPADATAEMVADAEYTAQVIDYYRNEAEASAGWLAQVVEDASGSSLQPPAIDYATPCSMICTISAVIRTP